MVSECGTKWSVIKKYLEENYNATECMVRDRELERQLIQKSKVELMLMIDLDSQSFDDWKDRFKNDGWSDEYVKRALCDADLNKIYGQEKWYGDTYISTQAHTYKTMMVGTRLHTSSNRYRLADIVVRNGNTSEMKDFLVSPRIEVDGRIVISENIGQLYHKKRGVDYDMGFVYTPILYIYSWCFGYESERTATEDLVELMGIDGDAFTKDKLYDHRSKWKIYPDMVDPSSNEFEQCVHGNSRIYSFLGKNGKINSMVHANHENNTLLPITAWTKESLGARYYLNLVPPAKYKLWGKWNIIENKDASIFLTDSIEIAADNQARLDNVEMSDKIWISWYGDKNAVDDVEWNYLGGRTVYYLIMEHGDVTLNVAYDTAYSAYKELRELRGIKLSFVELCRKGDESHHSAVLMTCDDFEKMAKMKLGITSSYPGFRTKTMREIIVEPTEKRGYLLEPILYQRSTTLMYAATNVGKTWMALCMSFIVSTGGTLFRKSDQCSNPWKAGKARNVLYIDCEMDEKSLRDRICIVNKMRFDGVRPSHGRGSKRFTYISRNRGDHKNIRFQANVNEFVASNKIDLVVLDNLSAFTQHNDSAKSWENIHRWLDQLKRNNCAILVIHHANKSGQQRGTSATTNAVDNVIRLQKLEVVGYDNALAMAVHVEKGRDIYGTAKQPFACVFLPEANPPCCKYIGRINTIEKAPPGRPPLGNNAVNASPVENKVITHKAIASGKVKIILDKKNCVSITFDKTSDEKRHHKSESERQEIANIVYSKLQEGNTVNKIASAVDISPSSVYKIAGKASSKKFKEVRLALHEKKRVRDNEIMEYHLAGRPVKLIAAKMKITVTSVRRIIERMQIATISPLLNKSLSSERIANKTGIEICVVNRIISKINALKVPALYEQGRTTAEIHELLSLPIDDINTIIKSHNEQKEEKEHIINEKTKLKRLYDGQNHKLKEVIPLIDMPTITVKRLWAWLDKGGDIFEYPPRHNPKRS